MSVSSLNNEKSNNDKLSNDKLHNKKISFIGGGNMAQALISGLLACGVKPEMITVSAPSMETRQRFADQHMHTVDAKTEPKAAITGADIIVLAVKPQVMKKVVSAFADALDEQLVISVAAGLSTEVLSDMLGGYRHIVRAMPNTPATIQMGATGLYATANITDTQKQLAEALMAASGLAMWVDFEQQMHAVTAVAGSAPAYVFYFIESMIDGAIALGLDKEQASALAMQTVLGAAQMTIDSEDSPSELRRKVMSPNGTTQAAIESMQHNEIARQIGEAMQACYDRSQALSEEMK
ncbi:pyrroline-5-carboxylate reductase [uncultured Psychrobacter sp.]|uniref:pyrroline-5-carboxylate reductase n=1 Tax=uncultured Psychrobacter sp. TaxID=259303 RepID=UPI003458F9A2